MFDTYQAAKLLNFSQLSLAFLLRHYCQVVVDKQFQLADWRIRPLPLEMINYAREDTHYLAYVYERMKQDLKSKGTGDNLLLAVWQNSRLVCLKRYRIPRITAESHLELYRLSKKVFNERQLFALKELFAWRDRVAREEDESTGFVLPKHMMLQIADVLPREMQGILACCSPIPPLVRQHLLHLHEIIRKAREMPLSSLQNHGQPLAIPKPSNAPLEHEMEDPLHCIHDLTHSQDIRDDLPTLLSASSLQSFAPESMEEDDGVSVVLKPSPQVCVFADPWKNAAPETAVSFVSPYARYARARAQILAEEKADQARVESLRLHFIESVQQSSTAENSAEAQQTGPEATTDNRSSDDIADKKRKKLPLAVQVNKKRKPGKKTVEKPRPAVAEVASGSTAQHRTGKSEATAIPSGSKKGKTVKKSADLASAAANFTPFDYTQVDYQAFQKKRPSGSDASGTGRGRGRGSKSRGGRSQNGRIHRKSGQKSMTYSAK